VNRYDAEGSPEDSVHYFNGILRRYTVQKVSNAHAAPQDDT